MHAKFTTEKITVFSKLNIPTLLLWFAFLPTDG